ncbi:sigma factor, partial [Falsirhodobacter sp. alg1]|uniref:sigma factor n=1 Tax=Falsirhodobacter sp. alg1 TaxID=1472418 RepID=UPI0023B8F328
MRFKRTPAGAEWCLIFCTRSLCRAFAISLTRNVSVADDLVQDTIVKAWTNFDKFTVGTNLRAWLFTILRNTFYSDKRKN